jgi:phospholipid/cholesterol/gamma-HCH transport system substrate-binding protein
VSAIRKHLRDFIAVAVLLVVALVATYIIVQQQRLRIPILEEKPFELKAEFQTAQAVVPGQGQTITVAGVRIGDVESVNLEHGVGVVTFGIDRKYVPIYKNATILMRPRTGLKDMFFELDPGDKSAGVVPEGGTIPTANTAPDVDLDQILQSLDSDTQAYLRLLLVGAGKGLKGQGKNLGHLLGSLGPINRDLDTLNSEVAQRRTELANLIHNLSGLTAAIGRHSQDVQSFVTANNSALSAIAEQDPDLRRTVQLLGPTLTQTQKTLHDVTPFAQELGPAFGSLRPFARKLPELNASTQKLANSATPLIKNKIRPFVRAARPAIPPLRGAAQEYAKATPRLTVLVQQINKLGNLAAYNPKGAEPCTPSGCPSGRDEGYLYWAAWLAHNGGNVFSAQDANGLYRRIYTTVTCSDLDVLLSQAGASIVSPFGVVKAAKCP